MVAVLNLTTEDQQVTDGYGEDFKDGGKNYEIWLAHFQRVKYLKADILPGLHKFYALFNAESSHKRELCQLHLSVSLSLSILKVCSARLSDTDVKKLNK